MSLEKELLQRRRRLMLTPCENPDDLHYWLKIYCGITVPRRAVCPGHCAPFDYLLYSYFEPATDLVVWAPRGGGKTRLAAAATLLDLLHKPGVAVRILGGSLQQSFRMWDHLTPDLEERMSRELHGGRIRGGKLKLRNGSSVAVLAQSQRAVRGLRVQKLRCDEVEMFDPDVWGAAQLVTRSTKVPVFQPGVKDSDGGDGAENAQGEEMPVAGTIEAISTLHVPGGMMNRIVDNAHKSGTPVLKWCLMEVLERCPPQRQCATCPLWDECRGVAKTQCDGFFAIDDAIKIKRRCSLDTWLSEALCQRPSRRGVVFPSFDRETHVKEMDIGGTLSLALDFGFHNPFVCLWIATNELTGVTHVIDEYVQSGRTVEEHIAELESRAWGKIPRVACDPAGAGRNEQTAESNVKLLKRNGYTVRYRSSRIVDGIELLRAALMTGDRKVRLFIHPKCERLIKALESYAYPKNGFGELPAKDGEHDHLIDALRYHFVNRAGSSEVIHCRY